MNGYVLAGGRSTRMGTDKAILQFAGQPLIAHAVDLLAAAGVKPHIVGERPDLTAFAPVIEDLHPGCGPLGGIEAALASSHTAWNLFVAVDLPLLPPAFLVYMIERTQITGAASTIPTWTGRPQPLCAVYRRSLLAKITPAVEAGDYKVMRVIGSAASGIQVDRFSVEAVVAARDGWPLNPPLHRWFQNMNTPSDMALVS